MTLAIGGCTNKLGLSNEGEILFIVISGISFIFFISSIDALILSYSEKFDKTPSKFSSLNSTDSLFNEIVRPFNNSAFFSNISELSLSLLLSTSSF